MDAKQTSGNTLHQGWKPRIISIVTSLYHSFVMLLGGEDYEWLNWPGKCDNSAPPLPPPRFSRLPLLGPSRDDVLVVFC